jgi:hypothetical protein
LVKFGHQELVLFKDKIKGNEKPIALQAQFNKVKFSFSQALHIWGECHQAKEGLQEVLKLMLSLHIQHQKLEHAEEIWPQIDPPDEAMQVKLFQLRKEMNLKQKEMSRLQAIGSENDPTLTQGPRKLLAIIIAIVSVIFVYVVGFTPIGALGQKDPEVLFYFSTAIFGPAILLVGLFRHKLIVNIHGKRAIISITSALSGLIVHRGLAWYFGQDPSATITIDMLLIALATINGSPSLKRGPLIAFFSLSTIPLILLFPSLIAPSGVLMGLVMGGVIFYEWVYEKQRFSNPGEQITTNDRSPNG